MQNSTKANTSRIVESIFSLFPSPVDTITCGRILFYMKWLKASWYIVITAAALWGSGIIPAVIPAAVPSAFKVGNGTKFAISGVNSGTSGNLLCNDATGTGNITDAACGGAAAAVPFSGVTAGTNGNALVEGTGGSISSSGTGIIESNKIRNYTVSTLPSGATGKLAYVTDGASSSDCTTGSGSTKVLCVYNGSAYVAIVNSGFANTTTIGAYASLPASGTTAGDQYITNDSSYRFTWTGAAWSASYLATPVTIPPAVSALTWVNQGGATTDETLGGIYLEVPANGSPSLRSLVKTLPACPGGSTFTVGLQNFMQGANFVHNGIFIRDSATAKTIIFGPGYNGGYQVAVDYYTNNTTFSSAPKEQNFQTLPLWYRVVDDCTNFSFEYSFDGQHFLVFYSAGRTVHTAAPNQAGIGGDSENNFITALRVFHWAGI